MIGLLKVLSVVVALGIFSTQARGAEPLFKLNALERIKKGKATADGVVASWKNQAHYRISIKNPSSKDAADLTVKYHIFVVRDTGSNNLRKAEPERISGEMGIPSVKGGETVTVETEPVTLDVSTITNGATKYSDHSRGSRSDMTRGIWVQLFSNGQMVGEFASLPMLKRTGPF